MRGDVAREAEARKQRLRMPTPANPPIAMQFPRYVTRQPAPLASLAARSAATHLPSRKHAPRTQWIPPKHRREVAAHRTPHSRELGRRKRVRVREEGEHVGAHAELAHLVSARHKVVARRAKRASGRRRGLRGSPSGGEVVATSSRTATSPLLANDAHQGRHCDTRTTHAHARAPTHARCRGRVLTASISSDDNLAATLGVPGSSSLSGRVGGHLAGGSMTVSQSISTGAAGLRIVRASMT